MYTKYKSINKYKSLAVFIILFPIFVYSFFENAQKIFSQYNGLASIKHIILTDTFFIMVLNVVVILAISIPMLPAFGFVKKDRWVNAVNLVLVGTIFFMIAYVFVFVLYDFYVHNLFQEMYSMIVDGSLFYNVGIVIILPVILVILVALPFVIATFYSSVVNSDYMKKQNFFTNPDLITFSYNTKNDDIKNSILHLVKPQKLKHKMT